MAWVGTAVSVGSAVYGAYQSNKQANAAIKAGKDPLRKERKEIAGMTMELLRDPGSFYNSPLYQAAFGQGTQATLRGFASQGYIGSGNMATGLQQFGQSMGYDMFMEYEKMLAQMAGFSDFQPRNQGLEGYANARGGMQDALGQLGSIIGSKPWSSGSSSGTPAYSSYDLGSDAGG